MRSYIKRFLVVGAVTILLDASFACSTTSPFIQAVENRDVQAVRSLISARGTDINATDAKGRTALIIAAENGQIELVKLLLKADPDVNLEDMQGRSAMSIAFDKRCTGIVQLLARAGARREIKNGVEAHYSIRDGFITRHDLPPLVQAAVDDDAGKVSQLIAEGANVNANAGWGITTLMLATELHNVKTVEVLLAAHADPNAQDLDVHETPLVIAATNGYADIVTMLLDNGADTDRTTESGNTALMFAAHQGYTDVVRALLAKGAGLAARNRTGATALIIAAHQGHFDIVKALVAKGADVEARDNMGATPLILATEEGQDEMVKALLGAGVRLNAATSEAYGSWTALMIASAKGYAGIVRMLLDAGAAVNLKGADDRTALMLAAAGGHAEVARMLLGAGADVSATNKEGKTAREIAKENGQTKLERLLSGESTKGIAH